MPKYPNRGSGRYAPTGRYGTSGLSEYSGYVFEEWLTQLQGSEGRRVYREMQDNDPLIGGILFGVEMLVRQVAWDIKPGDDNADSQEQADFIKDALFHGMAMTWADTLGEILTYLPWGFAVCELVYKRRDDGKVGWWGWPLRGQETLFHWEFDDDYVPTAMVQLGPPDWQQHIIPLAKCLHFRTSVRKNNPEGRALLRNCYLPYYFKTQIQTIEAIGVERDLAGFPVMYVPGEIMKPDAPQTDQQAYQNYQHALINLRRDDQEGLILPSDVDPDTKAPLYKLELLTSGGSRQIDTDAIVARYDQRIAMALLADFIMLGHEGTGSYALGSSKIDLFVKALDAWLGIIAAQVNTKAIPDLLRYNGIETDTPPQLIYDDIADIDLAALSTYLTALSTAGVPLDLTPDGPLVKRLMNAGNLPEAPEGTDFDDLVEQQRKLAEAKKPPMSVGPDGKPVMPGQNGPQGQSGPRKPAQPQRRAASEPTHKHEYSTTHVVVPDDIAQKLRAFGRSIPAEDLANDGREDTPHVTVKYGLHTNDAADVRPVLAGEHPISATFGQTSIFPASETGSDYDVVKVDVHSTDLHRLNGKISGALDHTDTHPGYQPHMTVAYVKAGRGNTYAGNAFLDGTTAQFDSVVFSNRDGDETTIPLKG